MTSYLAATATISCSLAIDNRLTGAMVRSVLACGGRHSWCCQHNYRLQSGNDVLGLGAGLAFASLEYPSWQ